MKRTGRRIDNVKSAARRGSVTRPEASAMRVANICWYLCGLFAVALLLASAATVHPDAQAAMAFLMGAEAVLSILFGILAAVLKRLNVAEPRWVVRLFQGLAVLATILVLLTAVG
jgi:hypothetical protein